jgi:hypothetical protein
MLYGQEIQFNKKQSIKSFSFRILFERNIACKLISECVLQTTHCFSKMGFFLSVSDKIKNIRPCNNIDPPAAEYSERTKVIIRPGSTLCYPLLHLFKIKLTVKHAAKRQPSFSRTLYFCAARKYFSSATWVCKI